MCRFILIPILENGVSTWFHFYAMAICGTDTTPSSNVAFQCPFPGCGRRFSVSSNMRRHSRVHTQPRLSADEMVASISPSTGLPTSASGCNNPPTVSERDEDEGEDQSVEGDDPDDDEDGDGEGLDHPFAWTPASAVATGASTSSSPAAGLRARARYERRPFSTGSSGRLAAAGHGPSTSSVLRQPTSTSTSSAYPNVDPLPAGSSSSYHHQHPPAREQQASPSSPFAYSAADLSHHDRPPSSTHAPRSSPAHPPPRNPHNPGVFRSPSSPDHYRPEGHSLREDVGGGSRRKRTLDTGDGEEDRDRAGIKRRKSFSPEDEL